MERTFKKKSKKLFLLEEYGISKDMMTKKKESSIFLYQCTVKMKKLWGEIQIRHKEIHHDKDCKMKSVEPNSCII